MVCLLAHTEFQVNVTFLPFLCLRTFLCIKSICLIMQLEFFFFKDLNKSFRRTEKILFSHNDSKKTIVYNFTDNYKNPLPNDSWLPGLPCLGHLPILRHGQKGGQECNLGDQLSQRCPQERTAWHEWMNTSTRRHPLKPRGSHWFGVHAKKANYCLHPWADCIAC